MSIFSEKFSTQKKTEKRLLVKNKVFHVKHLCNEFYNFEKICRILFVAAADSILRRGEYAVKFPAGKKFMSHVVQEERFFVLLWDV